MDSVLLDKEFDGFVMSMFRTKNNSQKRKAVIKATSKKASKNKDGKDLQELQKNEARRSCANKSLGTKSVLNKTTKYIAHPPNSNLKMRHNLSRDKEIVPGTEIKKSRTPFLNHTHQNMRNQSFKPIPGGSMHKDIVLDSKQETKNIPGLKPPFLNKKIENFCNPACKVRPFVLSAREIVLDSERMPPPSLNSLNQCVPKITQRVIEKVTDVKNNIVLEQPPSPFLDKTKKYKPPPATKVNNMLPGDKIGKISVFYKRLPYLMPFKIDDVKYAFQDDTNLINFFIKKINMLTERQVKTRRQIKLKYEESYREACRKLKRETVEKKLLGKEWRDLITQKLRVRNFSCKYFKI